MDRKGGRTLWIVAGIVGLLVVAGVAIAIGSSGGSSSEEPFSYSVEERRKPCSAGVFLPQQAADEFLDSPPPGANGWSPIQNHPQAIFANSEIVELHLDPGTEEEVTLEGIDFEVQRGKRPKGTVLYPPCYKDPTGRIISADFNQAKPRVGITVEEFEGVKTLSFPWTISLEEPVTVLLVPATSECHCSWRATIPWRSGAERGKIVVAEGKKDFELTTTTGLEVHFSTGGEWS